MSHRFAHEESYGGAGIASFFHRQRLAQIERAFREIAIGAEGKLADFGCSNGFIIERLQRRTFRERDWTFVGWDHSHDLLELARQKKLRNATFRHFDLNQPDLSLRGDFDVVTCFATLEHVGDCETALENLYRACKARGYLVLSVPNEKGLAGLLKFFGRRLLRKNAYGDSFACNSQLHYVICLLLNRRIDWLREPGRPGWGPHLGFDVGVFERDLLESFVQTGRCALLLRRKTILGFDLVYVLQKTLQAAASQETRPEKAA